MFYLLSYMYTHTHNFISALLNDHWKLIWDTVCLDMRPEPKMPEHTGLYTMWMGVNSLLNLGDVSLFRNPTSCSSLECLWTLSNELFWGSVFFKLINVECWQLRMSSVIECLVLFQVCVGHWCFIMKCLFISFVHLSIEIFWHLIFVTSYRLYVLISL